MEQFYDYNDYVNMTKSYLRNYKKFQTSLANMEADIKAQEEVLAQMDDVGAAIAKYGDEPGGGTSELTTVEASADRHIKMQKDIIMKKADVQQIKLLLEKIDRSLMSLEKSDREIIQAYFIDGENAFDIGAQYYYSSRWVKSKAKALLRDISLMLFGLKSCPPQQRFIFMQ